MRDVLNHLNDALAVLRKVPEVSREDAYTIQEAIAALDVTLRLKTRNPSPVDDH